MLILSSIETKGRLHDSQAFERVWAGLPSNVQPIRSLADKVYAGQPCAAVARSHGATPIHHVKTNAKWTRWPETDYERMVRFQRQFPDRARRLRAHRSIGETAFSVNKNLTGERIRTRNPIAKKTDATASRIAQNIHTLVTRSFVVLS